MAIRQQVSRRKVDSVSAQLAEVYPFFTKSIHYEQPITFSQPEQSLRPELAALAIRFLGCAVNPSNGL
jgi:hypothetical protein